MTDDLKPAEESPPVLGLLGLARHVEQMQPQPDEPEPPPPDKEVDGEDAS